MNITGTATYNAVAAATHKVGAELPAALVRDMDALAVTAGKAGPLAVRTPHDLADAIAAALEAGRVVEDDEAVRRLLVKQALAEAQVSVLMETRADEQTINLLRRHAPAIIKAWAKPVEEADRRMSAARAAFGVTSLTDPNAVNRMSPQQMEVWGQARVAHGWLGHIVNGWTALTTTTNLARIGEGDRVQILAAMTGRQHVEALRVRPQVVANVVHDAGVPLSLATPEVFRERVEALAATRERLRAEAEDRAMRWVKPMGTGEVRNTPPRHSAFEGC